FAGFRSLTESPTVSDAVARLFTGFRSTSESLSGAISDTISKLNGKAISEAPPISDAAGRVFNGFRSTSEDLASTISDSISRLFTGLRSLTESPTVSDAVARVYTPGSSNPVTVGTAGTSLATSYNFQRKVFACTISSVSRYWAFYSD